MLIKRNINKEIDVLPSILSNKKSKQKSNSLVDKENNINEGNKILDSYYNDYPHIQPDMIIDRDSSQKKNKIEGTNAPNQTTSQAIPTHEETKGTERDFISQNKTMSFGNFSTKNKLDSHHSKSKLSNNNLKESKEEMKENNLCNEPIVDSRIKSNLITPSSRHTLAIPQSHADTQKTPICTPINLRMLKISLTQIEENVFDTNSLNKKHHINAGKTVDCVLLTK